MRAIPANVSDCLSHRLADAATEAKADLRDDESLS